MAVLACALFVAAVVVLVGAPSSRPPRPRPGPTWFDILPTLQQRGRRR